METIKNKNIIPVSTILLIVTCFPYLTFINTNFDSQPWMLLISVVIFCLLFMSKDPLSMPIPLFALFLVMLYAICIYLINSNLNSGLRSLAGYFSLFFITFASYRSAGKLKAKYFKYIVFVWFLVGVIQYFIDKRFGAFLLPRLSTSDTRGITSLSVEPSALCVVSLFFIIISDFLYAKEKFKRKTYFIIITMLLTLIVISYSALGFIFVGIYFFSKLIAQLAYKGVFKSIPKLTFFIFVPTFVFYLYSAVDSLRYSRAGLLINSFLKNPIDLL